MRKVTKVNCPEILQLMRDQWTEELKANPGNDRYRFRYRDRQIKSALLAECSDKCVYCESKVGHNTPGDVEHLTPTSVDIDSHFDWNNLSIACTECNRRKGRYHSHAHPFLNPYRDDVEFLIVHCGPIVTWRTGDLTTELTVRRLGLHDSSRLQLLMRKIETVERLNDVYGRLSSEGDPLIRQLLLEQISHMKSKDSEYSAMVVALCAVKDQTTCDDGLDERNA